MDRRDYLRRVSAVPIALFAGCLGAGRGPGGNSADGGGTGSGYGAVTIPGTAFSPLRTTVAPGETVTWYNTDTEPHRVQSATFSERGTDWSYDSGSFVSGERVTYTFEERGAYEYVGAKHGKGEMCGVVVVGGVTYDVVLPCSGSGGSGGICCPG
ncbi:MAG: plastocyanin/azurin family copper-binding protein [Halanaeroarchaeum sp.]